MFSIGCVGVSGERITRGRPGIKFAIFSQRSHPEDPGRGRSRTTAAGVPWRSLSKPQTASGATSTAYPSDGNRRRRTFRKALSSSMTKIRPIGASRSLDIGVFKVADKVALAIIFPSFCAIPRLLYASGITARYRRPVLSSKTLPTRSLRLCQQSDNNRCRASQLFCKSFNFHS